MSQEATINKFEGTAATPRSEAESAARGVQPLAELAAPARRQDGTPSEHTDPADTVRLFTLAAAYKFMAGTRTGLH